MYALISPCNRWDETGRRVVERPIFRPSDPYRAGGRHTLPRLGVPLGM